MTKRMALRDFPHHKRLTTMVRRDDDLGGEGTDASRECAKNYFHGQIKNPNADFLRNKEY